MLGDGGQAGGAGGDGEGLDRLLDETRALLAQARSVVEGSLGPRPAAGGADSTILGLYDELRARLERIDDGHVRALLHRITRNVERLNALGREVERVRRLRDAIGRL